jgi:hypothetical protein
VLVEALRVFVKAMRSSLGDLKLLLRTQECLMLIETRMTAEEAIEGLAEAVRVKRVWRSSDIACRDSDFRGRLRASIP